MIKLASVIDSISASINENVNTADRLSPVNSSPSISSELSAALLKTAASLRETKVEVTHADLANLIEKLRHG